MLGERLIVAILLLFGVAGVAACGEDDGSEIRDLNSETAVPSDLGSASTD